MSTLLLFNKPYEVLSQFTDKGNRSTLKDFINIADFYPAGRLDFDSEGLLLLTNDGSLQQRIANPKYKLPKTYLVQVEGTINNTVIDLLQKGILLKDGITKPAKARIILDPQLPPRVPSIRNRKNGSTSWIELTIKEGKNRQVRRMTAAAGFPTLRLFRSQIGTWSTENISPGEWKKILVNLPLHTTANNRTYKTTRHTRTYQQRK